jgi:flagellar M-ring protein FliF
VLSEDEAIHPRPSGGEQAIGIPGALSNRRPETPAAPAANTQGRQQPGANPAPAATPPLDKPEPAPTPPDTHRTTNFNTDRTVQYLEHPSWKLRAINIAVLVNNPSDTPMPAERVKAVDTLVTSAIGAGENRHVTVVDLPFAEDGAAAGEAAPPWWRQRWMTTVEQNTLLAAAGLLVLFGGVFPLLRRIGVRHGPIARPAAAEVDFAAHSRGDRTTAAAIEGVRVLPERKLSSVSEAREGPAVGVEPVRKLVADDPARTARIIKEWITRDRHSIKQAS